jgi:8-oxo-dGTP pyrophosphatase MutT (NUDIX family)
MNQQSSRRRRRGAIGVLQRQDRYLLIQRAAGIVKAGAWCFPGGHVEAGENSRAAIRRELREELGVHVGAGTRLGSLRAAGGQYVLAIWHFAYDGMPLVLNPEEVAAVEWLTIAEIRTKPGALASNDDVLSRLERFAASPARHRDASHHPHEFLGGLAVKGRDHRVNPATNRPR